MGEEKDKNFFGQRVSDGWVRIIITILFAVVSLFFLIVGYKVIISGVSGSWQIVSNFKGFGLYAASLSPGLLIILSGAVIFCFLPKAIKALK